MNKHACFWMHPECEGPRHGNVMSHDQQIGHLAYSKKRARQRLEEAITDGWVLEIDRAIVLSDIEQCPLPEGLTDDDRAMDERETRLGQSIDVLRILFLNEERSPSGKLLN